MRGHQLRFYVHPDDLPELSRKLEALGVLLVEQRSTSPEPVVRAIGEIRPGSTSLLTTPALVRHLAPRYMPSGDVWVLTAVSDPLVELSTSSLRDGRLLLGRVYYATEWSVNGQMEPKPRPLGEFGESIVSSLRTWLVKRDGQLLGPATAAAYDAGAIKLAD